MNCTHADTLIQKGLDGLLSTDERTRLDAHLDRCPACRAAWNEHRVLTRTATDWVRHPSVADDPGGVFTAQVMAQIDARRASVSAPSAWRLCLIVVSALSLSALSFWAGPLLLAHLPKAPYVSIGISGNAAAFRDLLQQFSHLPQDALGAWDNLTEHPLTLSAWVWSALAAVLTLNGAFVWHARHSQRTETAR
jgi:predicted anti-sigma-YlaC factor YlaD